MPRLIALLGVEEVSRILGVPVQTLYQWRHLGKGPRAAKIGRHLRYRAEDVDAWLAEQFDKSA